MPYYDNSALPDSIRRNLPQHAQTIFREAFNHAWAQYGHEGQRREEIAHRVAWSAVKKRYRKNTDGAWLPIQRTDA